MEHPVLYAIVFIVFFILALIGVYMKGKEHGRKDMLTELIDKKVISTDVYVKLLKVINDIRSHNSNIN